MKFPGDRRFLLLALLAVVLVFSALVIQKYRVSTPPAEPPMAVEEPRQLREVILYFGSEDGRYLSAEVREVEDCLEELDCLEATVQALLDGPVGDLPPVLPPQAVLRGIAAQEGTATVDFSRELVTGHPGGSMSELLTVYAVANTLAANFPHVRQVKILVEGETIETLKGHVDLRGPIQADFDLSRLPADPPGGDAADTTEGMH